jgi:ribose/xylose/arabinose/galactoside ABC-type transport system permease subunit
VGNTTRQDTDPASQAHPARPSGYQVIRSSGHHHREAGVAALLLLLVLGVGWARPGFLAAGNLRDILINSVTPAIAAVGMTALIVAGAIDISIGSILAVCAVVSASLAKAGWPTPGVLAAALAAGGLLGGLNGTLVAYAGIPAIIVTLAMLGLLRGLMTWITGGVWIRDLPASFSAWTEVSPLGLPLPVWTAAALAAAVGLAMARLRWGRWLYAVGSQERSARLSGVPVARVRLGAFALLGALVGLAAFVYASRFSLVQSNAGHGFELQVITGVVVGGTDIFGGRGTVLGSMLGVLLLTTVETALTFLHVPAEWVPAVQGCLILAAVLGDALRRRS